MTDIQRTSPPEMELLIYAVGNIANITPYPMYHMSGGEIHTPAGSALTSLIPYTSSTENGTYQRHLNDENQAYTIAVTAGTNRPMPGDLFGAKWIKFVGDATGQISIDGKG